MFIVHIILLFIILIIIDIIWLSLVKNKYFNMIYNIQKENVVINYYSVFITYIIMAFGVYYFTKNIKSKKEKILNAFIFGIISYGIYDFTNGALLKNWDFKLAILDTIWGGILMASTIYVYSFIL